MSKLKATARKALLAMRVKNAAVGVFLLGEREMLILGGRFLRKGRKMHKVVDVLAFPEPENFPHPGEKICHLGDIFLNKNLGNDDVQLNYLLIHGLLHLLGFSHGKRRDILKMETLEHGLMERIFGVRVPDRR